VERGRRRNSGRGDDDEPATAGGREGCVVAGSTMVADVWGPGPTAVASVRVRKRLTCLCLVRQAWIAVGRGPVWRGCERVR